MVFLAFRNCKEVEREKRQKGRKISRIIALSKVMKTNRKVTGTNLRRRTELEVCRERTCNVISWYQS